MSLPSRERGLKSLKKHQRRIAEAVAPFTGAWIEIMYALISVQTSCVAPFTGAWIEIYEEESTNVEAVSLPSRERGLKSF